MYVLKFNKKQSTEGNQALDDIEAVDSLCVWPAFILSEMVVQGCADILEHLDFKEACNRNLEYADKTVEQKNEAKRNGKKNIARLEKKNAEE